MKTVLLFLGNGVSIDLINLLGKTKTINLSNLFENGDRVPWPANNEPGFLSQMHCPELWKLGARPNIGRDGANKLISDIITCANVSLISRRPILDTESKNIYIRAYHELVSYLKYLFIFYNQEIQNDDLVKIIPEWGWSKLFNHLSRSTEISDVYIITYNYDIFLERILKCQGIPYQIIGFNGNQEKFKILKPHGSISFRSTRTNAKTNFLIKYNRDSLGGDIESLVVDEDLNYDLISNINAMIPPAGEAVRFPSAWSTVLRKEADHIIKQIQPGDDVFFGGLSYGSVDRKEIDSLIVELDRDINITIVNPDVDNTFGAVVSSLFEHYIHYSKSDILGGMYND